MIVKENYTDPVMEIVSFEAEDIIRTSNGTEITGPANPKKTDANTIL